MTQDFSYPSPDRVKKSMVKQRVQLCPAVSSCVRVWVDDPIGSKKTHIITLWDPRDHDSTWMHMVYRHDNHSRAGRGLPVLEVLGHPETPGSKRTEIALKHQRSVPQVVLRWLLQQGITPIAFTQSQSQGYQCIRCTIWLFNIAMENHHF